MLLMMIVVVVVVSIMMIMMEMMLVIPIVNDENDEFILIILLVHFHSHYFCLRFSPWCLAPGLHYIVPKIWLDAYFCYLFAKSEDAVVRPGVIDGSCLLSSNYAPHQQHHLQQQHEQNEDQYGNQQLLNLSSLKTGSKQLSSLIVDPAVYLSGVPSVVWHPKVMRR